MLALSLSKDLGASINIMAGHHRALGVCRTNTISCIKPVSFVTCDTRGGVHRSAFVVLRSSMASLCAFKRLVYTFVAVCALGCLPTLVMWCIEAIPCGSSLFQCMISAEGTTP